LKKSRHASNLKLLLLLSQGKVGSFNRAQFRSATLGNNRNSIVQTFRCAIPKTLIRIPVNHILQSANLYLTINATD
jgi:hypothetical protein